MIAKNERKNFGICHADEKIYVVGGIVDGSMRS